MRYSFTEHRPYCEKGTSVRVSRDLSEGPVQDGRLHRGRSKDTEDSASQLEGPLPKSTHNLWRGRFRYRLFDPAKHPAWLSSETDQAQRHFYTWDSLTLSINQTRWLFKIFEGSSRDQSWGFLWSFWCLKGTRITRLRISKRGKWRRSYVLGWPIGRLKRPCRRSHRTPNLHHWCGCTEATAAWRRA